MRETKRPTRSKGRASHKGAGDVSGVRAKQMLGQNFLMHQSTADRIADVAEISEKTTVLEIGPGTGMLTRSLLARAGKVVAVETDSDLIPVLEDTFAKELASKKLKLIKGDVREFTLSTLPKEYVVVANIPYYITGELIRLLLTNEHKPASLTFLVQKEVAVRITRDPKESLLSLAVKAYGTPKYSFTVPKGAFRPAPKVDSAVLHVANITKPFRTHKEEEKFFGILHAGFAHKRKRLAKNLEAVADTEKIQFAFTTLNLGVNARAEEVSLEAWKKISSLL